MRELWVHRELQVPEGPWDSRGTEVLLETKEPKGKVGSQVRQRLWTLGHSLGCSILQPL